MMGKEEIKEIIDKAKGFSERGHNLAALQLLQEALDEANFWSLSDKEVWMRKGLIYHCRGIIERAMGDYEEAFVSLQFACGFRHSANDTIGYAYSAFQLLRCKEYGKLPITDQEIEETKKALFAAMANSAASIADIGNMLQNLAYVEQVRGDIEKAIFFYEMVLGARRKAKDQQAIAFVSLRLAECYKANGQSYEARDSASFALGYFLSIDDEERIEEAKKVLREIKR
jgi:tetratricopeptide (TPR) repeat protein